MGAMVDESQVQRVLGYIEQGQGEFAGDAAPAAEAGGMLPLCATPRANGFQLLPALECFNRGSEWRDQRL
jgi:hypothetical protein